LHVVEKNNDPIAMILAYNGRDQFLWPKERPGGTFMYKSDKNNNYFQELDVKAKEYKEARQQDLVTRSAREAGETGNMEDYFHNVCPNCIQDFLSAF